MEGGGQQERPTSGNQHACASISVIRILPVLNKKVFFEKEPSLSRPDHRFKHPRLVHAHLLDGNTRHLVSVQDLEDADYKKPSDCREIKLAKKLSMSRSLV